MKRWIPLAAALFVACLVGLLVLWGEGLPGTARSADPGPVHESGAVDTPEEAQGPRLQGRSLDGPSQGKGAEAKHGILAARRFTLRGEVLEDETYEPLAGVLVRLGHSTLPTHGATLPTDEPSDWFHREPVVRFVAERTTGSDGTFSFKIDGLRGWALLATKEGFSPAAYSTNGVEAPDEGEAVRLELPLHRGVPVRLQVVDSLDRPIPSVRVAQYSWIGGCPPVAVVHTDEEGWFELTVGRSDDVVFEASGFARLVEEYILSRAHAPIVLTRPHTLAGVVVDEVGEPIEGAVVWVEMNAVPPCVTDGEGRFRWDDLTLDTSNAYVGVNARSADRLPGWAYVAPGRDDVRLVLARPGLVTGELVFPKGVDPQPTEVRVNGVGNWRRLFTAETTSFSVEGAPPGRLLLTGTVRRHVRVWGRDHAVLAFQGELEVERLPGRDLHGVQLQLDLVPLSYAVIRVVDPDGAPIAGAWHYVDTPYGGAGARRSDAEGRLWSARAVEPGTPTSAHARLVVKTHDGSGTVRSPPVPLRTVADPDADPVEVVLDPDPAGQSASARLVLTMEREDGVPIPADAGANWHVSQSSNTSLGRGPSVTPPQVAGGRWRGELVIESGVEARVLAWASGCARRRFVVPPCSPGETAELTCRLSAASRVLGRRVTPTGRAATWFVVRVRVYPSGESPVQSIQWPDDLGRDGRFVLDQAAAGPARVSVERPDGSIVAQVDVDIPKGATLDVGDIVLGSLPRVRGVVRDVNDRALSGVWVELLEPRELGSYQRTSTQGDGRFELAVPSRPNALVHLRRGGFAPWYGALASMPRDEPWALRLLAPGTVVVESGPLPADTISSWLLAYEGRFGRTLGSQGGGHPVGAALRWAMRGLPIGPVRFAWVGRRADGSRWVREIQGTVVSGETITLRFENEK